MIRKTETELKNNVEVGLLTGLIEGYDFTYTKGVKGVVYSDGKGAENGVCGKVFFSGDEIEWLNREQTEFSIKTPFEIKGKTFEILNTSITEKRIA